MLKSRQEHTGGACGAKEQHVRSGGADRHISLSFSLCSQNGKIRAILTLRGYGGDCRASNKILGCALEQTGRAVTAFMLGLLGECRIRMGETPFLSLKEYGALMLARNQLSPSTNRQRKLCNINLRLSFCSKASFFLLLILRDSYVKVQLSPIILAQNM